MENLVLNNLLSIETLKKYEENFINYLDVDEKTLKNYRCGINNFCDYLRNNNITSPTRNDFIRYRDYLRKNYLAGTVNTYMSSIRALFKYLEIHKVYENITENVKGSRRSNVPKRQVLTLEQIKYIYNDLDNVEDKAMWSLLFTTGIRGCELVNADIEDIKIYNNEVVLFILGKKRDSKCEYVKLSDEVLNDIKEYIGDRTKGAIFVSTSNNNKGNRLTTKSVRERIKKIFNKYGFIKDYSLHSTRRSCATVMYELGQDVYSIQQVLHHKSISTTSRYINSVVRNNNKSELIVSNAIFGSLKGGDVYGN